MTPKESLDTEADLLQKGVGGRYGKLTLFNMEFFILNPNSDIPTLGQIAMRYGTLNQEQLDHAEALLKKGNDLNQHTSFTRILLDENLATPSQISLLELIREFLIIKKSGEQFGQIAIEKGYATHEQIKKALAKQQKEFKKSKIKRMIGDILVESRAITPVQKKIIATEQRRLEETISAAFSNPEYEPTGSSQPTGSVTSTATLSKDEKAFLEIQALDIQFGVTVVTKGYAPQSEVDHAVEVQEAAFKKNQTTTLLGDIMVAEGMLTPEQKNSILAEQNRLKTRDTETGGLDPDRPDNTLPDATLKNVIRIDISKDGMEAKVHLATAREKPVNLSDLKKEMEARGIRYGIFEPALLQCHLDNNQAGFITARGRMPIFSGDGVAHLEPGIFKTPSSRGRSNYRGTTLKKGQPLAVIRNQERDIPGKNVFGKPLTEKLSGITPPPVLDCGWGVRLSKEKDRALAGRSGVPHRSIDRSLFVFSALTILEDADLRFGPLEQFSNVNVAGILTDAYPVTAGRVKAREIRGTKLEALGDIHVTIGITNARIKTQGSVHARYIHNSTIEAYGDVIVEHEILDSTIIISGSCRAKKSRIIASTISAKQGVKAAGAGSDVTEPCTISAGREDHILLENERINTRIETAQKELNDFKDQQENLEKKARQLFNKMVKLKLFHDRAKQKKESVTILLSKKGPINNRAEQQKTNRLLDDLAKKMSSTINLLRDINKRHKSTQNQKKKLLNKITALEPRVKKTVTALERERLSILEWTQKKTGTAEILISGRVAQDTVFKGVYSSMTTTREISRVKIAEKTLPEDPFNSAMAVTALGKP